MNAPVKLVHHAYGAGRWFPGTAGALRQAVQRYLDAAPPAAVPGRIVGAIAPHAGYEYSGAVAGHVFRALRDQPPAEQPQTVVVLGGSHQARFAHVALLDGEALATPLGATELDREAAELLTAASPRIRPDHRPHVGEHSAENQIPFVQVALPAARLVVALLGEYAPATVEALTRALTELAARRRIAVVASSDMLHDPSYERVCATDRATLRKVAALDVAGVVADWSGDRQVFCGLAPVAVAMQFARACGCQRGTVLAYRNCGDDYPETRGHWVVGYGAVVFAVGAAA